MRPENEEHGLRIQLATALRALEQEREQRQALEVDVEGFAAARGTIFKMVGEKIELEKALAAARRECERLRNALGAAHDHAHAAGCRSYLGEDFFSRIRAALGAPAAAAGEEG